MHPSNVVKETKMQYFFKSLHGMLILFLNNFIKKIDVFYSVIDRNCNKETSIIGSINSSSYSMSGYHGTCFIALDRANLPILSSC